MLLLLYHITERGIFSTSPPARLGSGWVAGDSVGIGEQCSSEVKEPAKVRIESVLTGAADINNLAEGSNDGPLTF